MGTPAADVLKPDFAASRRHFIFTEEHDRLRESIHAFVTKELAPHAEEWEETTFPDSVFRAHGRAGAARPLLPRGVRRPGRRLLLQPRARRGDGPLRLRRPRHGRRGPHGHGDARPSTCSAPRSRSSATSCPRSRASGSAASGSPSPTPARTSPGIRTHAVRDGDEWVIDGAKTYITNGHRADFIVLVAKTDRGRRARRDQPVPGRHGPAGRDPRAAAARSSACTPPTPRCSRSRTSACPRTRSSARSARASTTSCGSSRASG